MVNKLFACAAFLAEWLNNQNKRFQNNCEKFTEKKNQSDLCSLHNFKTFKITTDDIYSPRHKKKEEAAKY